MCWYIKIGSIIAIIIFKIEKEHRHFNIDNLSHIFEKTN